MNLILDIGNTRIKVCIFDKTELVYHSTISDLNQDFFRTLQNEFHFEKIIFSDTRGIDKESVKKYFTAEIAILELTHQLAIPIKLKYKTPETLGKDRIAAAVAAADIFRDYPCLIIDIGTALTIDFIDNDGNFEGGIISPGLELRFRALHEFTGKLPKVEPAENTELIGDSTNTAIQFGVQNGLLYEINEYISRFMKHYPLIKIIITGGDAFLFDKKINYPIFADSFLIPKGLNRILIYNELHT